MSPLNRLVNQYVYTGKNISVGVSVEVSVKVYAKVYAKVYVDLL